MEHLAFTWIVESMRLGLCGVFCGIELRFRIHWCVTKHLNLVTRLGNRWLSKERLCKNGGRVLMGEHPCLESEERKIWL